MSDEPKYRDGSWLREQYIQQQKSTVNIANECGCATSTVTRWLEKHGIERRYKGGFSKERKYHSKEWLREQYVVERKTTTEIAKDCGCDSSTVVRWLDKHNIETRNSGDRALDERLHDPDWLREKYLNQRVSCVKIAEECGCHESTVRRALEEHNIKTLPLAIRVADKRLTDSEWLRKRYVEQSQSADNIAKTCDCTQSTVFRWLHEHNIETRHDGYGVFYGPDNHNWNGGPTPYGAGWTKAKRRAVRERDDHTCQDPRCSVTQADHRDEYGEKLHVHHLRKARDVDDPEQRNAKENLITLCRDCHRHWEQIADTGLVPEVDA